MVALWKKRLFAGRVGFHPSSAWSLETVCWLGEADGICAAGVRMNDCGYTFLQSANKMFTGCIQNMVQQTSSSAPAECSWKSKNLMECPCWRGTVPVFAACSGPATMCGCTNVLIDFSMALKAFFCNVIVWKLTNASPFQMKGQHWYHMSYCLGRWDVYFKYLDLISLHWWQAENKRLVLSCCAFSDLSSLFSQYLLSSLLSLHSWRKNWGVFQLEGKALRNAVLLDIRDSMWECS